MAKVSVKPVTTFIDFVKIVEGLQAGVNHSLWYRGCGRADHKLLPTLYRHRTITTIDEIGKLEAQLMMRFRQRSIPMHTRSLTDDWDALFFMQHYGTPTRLLDWTENPLTGLYFAVMSADFDVSPAGTAVYRNDAAVWVLDPIAWNKHSLLHQSFDGGVLAPGDDDLKGYKPTPKFQSMNNSPVALYGAHNSPRIVAQRGVFTIFGQTTEPMEIAYNKKHFPPDCLIKIKIKKADIAKIRASILNHGVTESVVFPDLDGLSKEIRRDFGF